MFTKTITFNKEDRDYLVEVNGNFVCYASSMYEAEKRASEYVCRLLDHPHFIPAVEVEETVVVAVEAVAIEVEEVVPAVETVVAVVETVAPITPETVARAGKIAIEKASRNPRWVRAIEKALKQLDKNTWAWYASNSVLRCKSATQSKTSHTATRTTCTCKAHARNIPCWHIAAARLLSNAQQVA